MKKKLAIVPDLELAIAQEYDPVRDWIALETFFGSPRAPEIDAFMFMGRVRLGDGLDIYDYKHQDTRRYLQLDIEGNTYCYGNTHFDETGWYEPMTRRKALERVYEGIDELSLRSPGSLPRREIFPCERNKPAAA
jgi:hypothetical protein